MQPGRAGAGVVLRYLISLMVMFSGYDLCLASEDGKKVSGVDRQLETILTGRLEYYSHHYPDILFLNLHGGEDIASEMTTLDILLGHKPVNLDYEHPEGLRNELMLASIGRIWMMLENQLPSASLFRADMPRDWQEKICVLTIDPDSFALTDIHATRHLLELSEDIIQSIPLHRQLNREDYLVFVIDHEVYHCLRSAYLESQPMSDRELWGEYYHYMDEKGADAFALGMHIRKYKLHTEFAKNIKRIRSLSLLNADPAHLTTDAMNEVMKRPVNSIAKMDTGEIFALVNRIKKNLTPGYDDYLSLLASVVVVMKKWKLRYSRQMNLCCY